MGPRSLWGVGQDSVFMIPGRRFTHTERGTYTEAPLSLLIPTPIPPPSDCASPFPDARPLLPVALAFMPYGFVLVRALYKGRGSGKGVGVAFFLAAGLRSNLAGCWCSWYCTLPSSSLWWSLELKRNAIIS